MKKTIHMLTWCLASIGAFQTLSGCYKNPVTGRSSLHLIDNGTINNLSLQQYQSFLSQSKPVKGTPEAAMVQKVGNRLALAIKDYFHAKGQDAVLKGYNWEFNLVNAPEANAWCMPGGKVAVYTGILPFTKNEAGLAVVMGHEIAHAIAEHGNERMSQGLVQQLGGIALSTALSNKPDETRAIYNNAYGVATQVGGILPFSRKHESEADAMGLVFMAMAGYDPHEAMSFWERMATAQKGNKPPELLSTHPSDQNRIAQIRSEIPKAMQYFKKQGND